MNDITPDPTAVVADPKRPYKAYAATALAMVAAFVAFWIGDDDPFTKKDAGEAFLSSLAAGGFTGLPTYLVRNPKVTRQA